MNSISHSINDAAIFNEKFPLTNIESFEKDDQGKDKTRRESKC